MYPPGGAGQTETHRGSPPKLCPFNVNNIVNLRLRSNMNDGKLPDLPRQRLNH